MNYNNFEVVGTITKFAGDELWLEVERQYGKGTDKIRILVFDSKIEINVGTKVMVKGRIFSNEASNYEISLIAESILVVEEIKDNVCNW